MRALSILVLLAGVSTARAESITVDGTPLEVVGRARVPLAALQEAADKYPHAVDLAISAVYYDRGFATVKVGEDGGRLVIREGDLFRFRTVRAFDKQTKVAQHVRHVRKGKLFSRALVHVELEALGGPLRDTGYAFANVLPIVKLDLETKQVDLTFEIERGPITRIHRIVFDGNVRTPDEALLKRTGLAAGQLFNESALVKAKTTLEELGMTGIAISTKRVPDHDDRIQVTIEVTEQAD